MTNQKKRKQSHQNAPGPTRFARWLERRRVVAIISLMFICSLVGMTAYVLHLESELVKSMAVSDVSLYSTALEEFRTVYTSEVVERARQEGVLVTHDYKAQPGAIPLPATLSLLLGRRIYGDSGGSVHLYSAHPFPWRAPPEGGPRDDFERLALASLQKNPASAFMKFESRDGQITLRYATADLMRDSCVNCHNSHPSSPKTDWKVGDVRGVLSVTRPIEHGASAVRASLRLVVGLLAALAVLALVILGSVAIRLRRAGIIAGQLAAETARTNRELEKEIEVREQTEAESRKFEQQMRQAQKLEGLGVLAGGIAHDFNNLLLGVLGNAQLAKANLESSTDAHHHIKRIETAANRAKELTRQLLAYAGRGSLVKETVNLTSMIRETSELLETAVAQTATVKLDLSDNLPALDGDRAQLQQVLMNLLTNAAESIDGEQGTINIRTRQTTLKAGNTPDGLFGATLQPGVHIVLTVEDNGKGMDRATKERMFDPFFSTKVSGSGLGLAALQGIVRSHAGALSVRSAPGKGTKIQIWFPVIDATAPPLTKSTSQPVNKQHHGTILVVDDQDFVLVTVSMLLEHAGRTTLTAASGAEAIAALKEHDELISSVLLDIRMPNMGGVETMHELRKIRPDLHIVLTSGNQADGAIEQLIADGTTGFLQKPYTEDELLRALRVPMAKEPSQ